MTERVQIDDLIVLGRSAPSIMSSDKRHTVCVGGYSPSMEQFIRIYPTKVRNMKLKRWNKVSVEVERNPEDHRKESFKMPGSKEDWEDLHEKMEITGRIEDLEEKRKLLREIENDNIGELKEQDRSMGLVRADIEDAYIGEREKVEAVQEDIKGRKIRTKKNFQEIPRVKFSCGRNCQIKSPYHDKQILEWGIYEFLRKCKYEDEFDKDYEVEEVLNIKNFLDDEYEHYFLAGDIASHPKTFIVISTIYIKKKKEKSLKKF